MKAGNLVEAALAIEGDCLGQGLVCLEPEDLDVRSSSVLLKLGETPLCGDLLEPFTLTLHSGIERLERIFAVPDIRPLSQSDLAAANRRHDEMLAHSPWFQLWQRYGVCCRTESPVLRLGETES